MIFGFDPTILCRQWSLRLLLPFMMAISGCVISPSMTYDSKAPPTANLPLKLSGIIDGRSEFFARFTDELSKTNTENTEEFIHPPADLAGKTRRPTTQPNLITTAVLVIPGLFGECVDDQALPFTDGKYRDRTQAYITAYENLKIQLGAYSVAAVRLAGRGSSETNGAHIAKALTELQRNNAVQSIIIVAYSKGSADTLHALAQLARDDRISKKPIALASVAGAVMGSPIADRYAPIYSALQGLIDIENCHGSQGSDFNSITRAFRSRWLTSTPLPTGVAMYSLVAHAQRELIAPALLPFYDLLSMIDPRNDGQIIASDAILPGSTLLAEIRSDHWDLAMPLAASRNPLIRSITSKRSFPRDELFLSIVRHLSEDLERGR